MEIRPRTPWTFPVSVFKDYRTESAVKKECFEFDWETLKKPKFKISTEFDVKDKMRDIYDFIREVYK